MDGSEAASTRIGWLRALATGIVILVAGYALLAWLPNWMLGHLDGLSRSGRVAAATAEFVVAFALLAFVLRRLQARRAI